MFKDVKKYCINSKICVIFLNNELGFIQQLFSLGVCSELPQFGCSKVSGYLLPTQRVLPAQLEAGFYLVAFCGFVNLLLCCDAADFPLL